MVYEDDDETDSIVSPELDDEINRLIQRFISCSYSEGAITLARLCLLFEFYDHPMRDKIVRQLHDLGKNQQWFHGVPETNVGKIVADPLGVQPASKQSSGMLSVDISARMESMSLAGK